MPKAQDYLNKNYPLEERKRLRTLNVSEKNLESELDLKDFINLKKLECHNNKLTKIIFPIDNQIKVVNCRDNQLTDTLFIQRLNPDILTELYVNNNNFSSQTLEIFRPLVNLESLWLGNWNQEKISQNIYNKFHDSLEPLQNMDKLESLNISNTDINDGLEFLPECVEYFYCLINERPQARVKEIYELFAKKENSAEEGLYINNFPEKLKTVKFQINLQEKNKLRQQVSELQRLLISKEQEALNLRHLLENELTTKEAKVTELTTQLQLIQQNALQREQELRQELANVQQQNNEFQAQIVLMNLRHS